MSAFDRLPKDYREACKKAAAQLPRRAMALRSVPISPQNRRVRLAVDLERARAKGFNGSIRATRQLTRAAKRRGAIFAPSTPIGPDEV